MQDYHDRLSITTTEGVAVELQLAGLGSRFTATLLDLLLKGVVLGLLALIASILGDLGLALLAPLSLVVYLGYDILFETRSGGQTPGKRRTGLRVLRDDGHPVDLTASTIRNLMRLIDGLPLSYVPGMVSILLTRRGQRLGDLTAGTIVVREHRDRSPAPVRSPPPPLGRAAEPATLDTTAISESDLATARGFLERRADLDPATRGDLARRLAAALISKVAGELPPTGDEALIEHVVAAATRRDAA